MIKLKKLIAIAVLVAMLPSGARVQGEEKKKDVKTSEGQKVSTTETEPNEESFADVTVTTECEASESMELPDEHRQHDENKHSESDSVSESELDSVCTETAMVDDEENTDMPENRKESTTETKSDKDDVAAIAASNQEEKEKSANNMYMQGVQCENNMEFCKAIEFYKQATELGSTAAASKLAEFHLYDKNDFYKMYEWCEWASILFRKAECLKDLNSRYKALPSCADPILRFLAHNQIYECKIELNSLKNKLKSLESNLFIMKDKIKNSPFAWYKNAAKIISIYLDTLQSENIEISPEPLYDFLKCCEIIKNENPEKVLNWFEIASKSGNADVMCKLAEYLDSDLSSGSEPKKLESTEDSVCTETAMVDDEENTDMPENRKESTTETKSDKDDVAAIAASNQEEKEKSANNMYMQGVQCENNMEFCKAIEFYKQATELGSTAAASKLAEFHLYDKNDFYKMYEWCEWASILFRKAECLKDLNSRYKALPSCADPILRFLAHNQIYECKIELNSLKNKLKSLESNLFIMKDKIKNSPFAWYKNAAKIISIYLDTLQSENIEISPEPLYDFLKCCEIIKNENPEKVLNWFEIASKSGNADVMCKLAEYYETRQRIKKR